MIRQFQVGDVVYVNELTPDIVEQRNSNKYQFDDQIETLVGKHAVVTSTDSDSSGIVGLVQCESDYQFQLGDAPRLDNEIPIETVPAQVTLVHGSLLRACRISDAVSAPLGGVRLPSAGDTIVGPASDEQTPAGRIRTPYNVKGLCIVAHHIIVELSKNNERIVCIRFVPFECLDTTSSPFTTF